MTDRPPHPSGSSPGLRLRKAGLAYGGRSLFQSLDLDLDPGRTTCLLGPSGIGKSSLLRLIAGLGDAATGRVTDESGALLTGRIAYMAQQDLLLPWLTAEENVMIGARLRGEASRADRERARALLVRVGLEEAAQLRPAALSGGMRQRVALARALFGNPALVVLDEPNSNLDEEGERALVKSVQAMKQEKRTVVIVTHRPQILAHVDNLLVMGLGRQVAFGARDEVIARMRGNKVAAV